MNLKRLSEEEYGQQYQQHYLEIYKLFTEMADRVSSRRQSANSFFLTINTALIAATSYISFNENVESTFYSFVSLAGMMVCLLWFCLILSYRNLNRAKYTVVHEIERKLPIAPYDAEWDCLDRGKSAHIYWPLTHVEMVVPWTFFVLHALVLTCSLIS